MLRPSLQVASSTAHMGQCSCSRLLGWPSWAAPPWLPLCWWPCAGAASAAPPCCLPANPLTHCLRLGTEPALLCTLTTARRPGGCGTLACCDPALNVVLHAESVCCAPALLLHLSALNFRLLSVPVLDKLYTRTYIFAVKEKGTHVQYKSAVRLPDCRRPLVQKTSYTSKQGSTRHTASRHAFSGAAQHAAWLLTPPPPQQCCTPAGAGARSP